LSLIPPRRFASSASLTLSTPGKFIQLGLLTTAGNGPCSINITVHFTDLSTTSYGSFSVSDWFGGSSAIIGTLGRITRTSILGAATGLGSGDPGLPDHP